MHPPIAKARGRRTAGPHDGARLRERHCPRPRRVREDDEGRVAGDWTAMRCLVGCQREGAPLTLAGQLGRVPGAVGEAGGRGPGGDAVAPGRAADGDGGAGLELGRVAAAPGRAFKPKAGLLPWNLRRGVEDPRRRRRSGPGRCPSRRGPPPCRTLASDPVIRGNNNDQCGHAYLCFWTFFIARNQT